jgi:outer membrane lipoprotein LolB
MRRARVAAVRWMLRLGASAFVLAGLAACAPTALERREVAPVLPTAASRFEANGRLSARHGAEAFAGGFRWEHDADRDELALLSPTGQTVALLSGDAHGVRLQESDGSVETARDWSALTEKGLGWPLPVDGLAFWIQGAPRSDAPFTVEAGADGHAAVLRQDGWTIVYQAYALGADTGPRPTRLTLSYPDLELRLAVDSWR